MCIRDSVYMLGRLKRMADARLPKPLIEMGGDLTSIRYGDVTVALTPFGREVLDGKASSYPINPIDDWAAGVHLSSREGNLWFNKGGRLVLSLIHISEPTRLLSISYAVFCL